MLVETRPAPQLELGSHLLDFIFMNLGTAKEAFKSSLPSTLPASNLLGGQQETFDQSMGSCGTGPELINDKPLKPEEESSCLAEDTLGLYVCDVCKGAGVLFCLHEKQVLCRKCDISIHQQCSHQHHRRYLFGDCMLEDERSRLLASLSGPTPQREGALYEGAAANNISRRCSGTTGVMEDIMGFTNEEISAPIFASVEKSLDGGNIAQALSSEGPKLLHQHSSRLPDLCILGEDSLEGGEELMDMDWLAPLVEDQYNLKADPATTSCVQEDLKEEPLFGSDSASWLEGQQQKVPALAVGRPRSRRAHAGKNQRLWLASQFEDDDDDVEEPRRKPRRRAKKPMRRTALPRLGSEDRGCCEVWAAGDGNVAGRERLAEEAGARVVPRGLGEGMSQGRALCGYSMLRPGAMVRLGIKFQGESIQLEARTSSGGIAAEAGSDRQVKVPEKKGRGRKPGRGKARDNGDGGVQRRCMHCSTTKTPQWRAGPLGPKTLCNACGVRYKSGRLVPEYRPMGSPNFIGSPQGLHRKVTKVKEEAANKVDLDVPVIANTSVEEQVLERMGYGGVHVFETV